MSDLVTSPNGQDMMRLLPHYYATSRVIQAIMQVEGLQFDGLEATLDDIVNQFYVETATWGLDLWENMLRIPAVPGKPYEQRRAYIISRLRGIGTASVALILNVAQSYVNGNIEFINNQTDYSFTIKFNDIRGIPPNLVDLQTVIEEIKPAHLAVNYQFTYTLVGNLVGWGTTVGDLITGAVTVEQLMTYQPEGV